jgi:hypothetical protein
MSTSEPCPQIGLEALAEHPGSAAVCPGHPSTVPAQAPSPPSNPLAPLSSLDGGLSRRRSPAFAQS